MMRRRIGNIVREHLEEMLQERVHRYFELRRADNLKVRPVALQTETDPWP